MAFDNIDPNTGTIGGLGGLGGFTPPSGNIFQALGASLMSSPGNNPLGNLAPIMQAQNQRQAGNAQQMQQMQQMMRLLGMAPQQSMPGATPQLGNGVRLPVGGSPYPAGPATPPGWPAWLPFPGTQGAR